MFSAIRVRRLQRRLAGERRLLLAIDDPIKQAREARKQIPEAKDQLRHTEEDEATDTERLPNATEYGDWLSYVAGAVAIALFDALAQFWFTWSSGLSKSASALISVIAAGGLPIFPHIFARRVLCDPLRLDRTKGLHLLVAALSGAVVLVGLIWFAVFRGLSPGDAGAFGRLSWLPFLAINIGAPIVVGVLSSLALYLWSFAEAKKRRLHRRRLIVGLREYLALLDTISSGNDTPKCPQHEDHRFPVTVLHGVVIIVGLALSASAARAEKPDCGIGFDCSASLDQVGRSAAGAKVEASLDSFLAAYGCRSLVLACFSDAGPFTPREIVPVLVEPTAVDCERAEAPPATGRDKLFEPFTNYRAYRKEEAEASCRKNQEALHAAWVRERAALAAKVHAVLSTPVASPDHGSAIAAFVKSAMTPTMRALLLVTDGIEFPQTMTPVAIPSGTSVVMVLVPPKAPHGTMSQTVTAAHSWLQRIPGLSVLFYPELHPDIWQQLAGKERP